MSLSHKSPLATVAVSLLASLFLTPPLVAQEEDLPTLKVDRIPSAPAFSGQTRTAAAGETAYQVASIATGLSAPWALAFLPGGEILITEYVGNMRILDAKGQLSAPLGGLPEMSHEGWAGLFDVALDPDFFIRAACFLNGAEIFSSHRWLGSI